MAGSRSGATRLIAFFATLGAFFGLARPLTGLLRKLRLAKVFLKLAQAGALIAGPQQVRLIAFEPSRFRRHLGPHGAGARARAYIVQIRRRTTGRRPSLSIIGTVRNPSR